MSTLADELLNDFEESGSEGEDEQKSSFLHDNASSPAPDLVNGHGRKSRTPNASGTMELDDDEEDVGSQDEEMMNGEDVSGEALADADDEEEAKAKVEKMQLGGVNDVRSVAGLMKSLEPVLQVGAPPFSNYMRLLLEVRGLHLFLRTLALTFSPPPCRKSHIISRYLPISRRPASAT